MLGSRLALRLIRNAISNQGDYRMRFTIALGVAAITGALSLIPGTASADPSPAGSYRATCNDISAERGTLSASCRTREGRWTDTELDRYRDCWGDIANIDGQLRCRRGDDDGDRWGDDHDHGGDHDRDGDRGGWMPRGSYQGTCRSEGAPHRPVRTECRGRFGRRGSLGTGKLRSCGRRTFKLQTSL